MRARLRATARVVLLCSALPPSSALKALAATGDSPSRAAALVNSFQVMCTFEPIDFARLNQKATAMKLPVRKSLKSPPSPNGFFVESKSWLLPLKTGPHELVATQALGAKGRQKSCGIGAPDVDAKEFRSELVTTLHLGTPSSETAGAGAYHKTTWPYAQGTLLLVDGGQARSTGIYLFLNE